MQGKSLYVMRFILPVADLTILTFAYLYAANTNYVAQSGSELNSTRDYLLVCNLVWIISALAFRLYGVYGVRDLEKIYRATWKTFALHLVLFGAYLLFAREVPFSLQFLLLFYSLLFVATIVNRFLGTVLQYALLKRTKPRLVAIMGSGLLAKRLRIYVEQDRTLHFYGFLASAGEHADDGGQGTTQVFREMTSAAAAGVTQIYVCIALEKLGQMELLRAEADRLMMRLRFIPDMGQLSASPLTMILMAGQFPVLSVRNEPLERMGNRFKKRAFDLIFSFVVVLFILSWFYPLLALLIRLDSSGPVLVGQKRSGRNDKAFRCYRFRTVLAQSTLSAQQDAQHLLAVTRMGRLLRRSNLDKLPEFINVLRGQMSIVGPRPHLLEHTEQYRLFIDKFMVRQFAKPGITGWAQVNGLMGETEANENIAARVAHDIHYIENWSLMWDIRIIFLTMINLIKAAF